MTTWNQLTGNWSEAQGLWSQLGDQTITFDFEADATSAVPAGMTVRNGTGFAVAAPGAWTGADGNFLRLIAPAGDDERFISFNHLDGQQDVDITCRMSFSAGTDGWQNQIYFRSVADPMTNSYMVGYETSGDGSVYLDRYINSSWSRVATASATLPQVAPDSWWYLRGRADGDTFYAKAWPFGYPEPDNWDLEFTDINGPSGQYSGVGAWWGSKSYAFDDIVAGVAEPPPPTGFVNLVASHNLEVSMSTSFREPNEFTYLPPQLVLENLNSTTNSLSWSDQGATKYVIERSSFDGLQWNLDKRIELSALSLLDDIEPGWSYRYRGKSIRVLSGSTTPPPDPDPGPVEISANFTVNVFGYVYMSHSFVEDAPAPGGDFTTHTGQIGAFLGSDFQGRDNIAGFETWLGAPVTVGRSYLASASWADLEGPNWVLDPWSQWVREEPGRIFALNVPMVSPNEPGNLTTGQISTLLSNGANGQYNSHFQTLAERLVAKNAADTTLVLGWEMTGFDFGHRAEPNPTAWINYWRQIVDTMRAVPGADFIFCFAPNRGQDNILWQDIWPGDNYVDEFGLSSYDQPPGASFSFLLNESPNGLTTAASFAASKGIPISIPEWGLFQNGDNVEYIEGMHAWILANNVRWHSITDYNPHGVYLYTGNPQSSARYQTLFSSTTVGGDMTPSFNSDGVRLDSFTLTPSEGSLAASYSIQTNQSVSFTQLTVAVRDGAGNGYDFGHTSPTINGTQLFSPSRSLAAGDYTAWVAYTLDGSTWVDLNSPQPVTIPASTGGGGGEVVRPSLLPTNYGLVFQDEFEGTSIDWSKWEPYGYALTEYGGKTTRRGNKNTNGQLEWNESDNPDNAWVSDSVLTFRNRRVTQVHNGVTYTWSGNHMTTQPTSAGRFYRNVYLEARIKAQSPIVNGFWPAFWTWQADGAGQGWQEVDIWEWWSAWEGGVRYSANAYQSGNQNGTVVYYANEGTTQATDWNVYGAWIRDDGVRIYLNGDLIASHPNVMQGEQYVIINMANEDNPSVQPPAGVNQYEIYWDWVRIWRP